MNFMKGTSFTAVRSQRRWKSPRNPAAESWPSGEAPAVGKTVTAVKIAKHLASQKKNVALLLCDMTAPMMPCICPPSELECDKSLAASSPPSGSP